MKLIVIFFALTVLFLILLLYYFDLLMFYFKERKEFLKSGDSVEYLHKLLEKHKRKKHRQKKNFLLYLICLTHIKQNNENRAKNLLPFLKKDLILGIDVKKEADH